MKKLNLLFAAVTVSLSMIFPSFAGAWQQQTDGKYKYLNDNDTYTAGNWQWIDGNGDGLAERYYFDESSICLVNTTTPDGATVNETGAWVIDGVVQTQQEAAQTQAANTAESDATSTAGTGISSSPYDGYTIVVNTSSRKYHVPSCKSVSSMKQKNTGYCSDASYLKANGYSACKNCH